MTTSSTPVHRDAERCYRAVASRDPRFDGIFFTAVRTTGIYCRPSCPAITPKRSNVTFHPTAAAAHAAGYRACKRCLPDATPGSPEWDVRADLVGQAMRLIRDGVVESEGVAGLAGRLGYSERHVTRMLTAELGAGPLAIARSRRAHAARILVETTDLGLADVAFAAGFASVRQFNDTMQGVYATTPSALRATASRRRQPAPAAGRLSLRLAVRAPFDSEHVIAFLAARAAPGLERVDGLTYSRVLRLPHGPGRVYLRPHADFVQADVELGELRDVATAVQKCRALLDLDADPLAVLEVLTADDAMRPLARARPGTRVPGAVDGFELAVRAVLGQQVTVKAATRLVGRLVAEHGDRLGGEDDRLHSAFPSAERLAQADPSSFGMPASRGRALVSLAEEVAAGRLSLDAGADRAETDRALRALPGIGPWTAAYIGMRALADPDRFLPGDVAVRSAMSSLGLPASGPEAASHATRWRPWRSYAVMHLWRSAAEPLEESA